MDVHKIGRMLQSAQSVPNNSQPNPFNPRILETFIPGYGIISRLLLTQYDVDLGQIIPLLVLAFTLYTSARFIWRNIGTFFENNFVSFIYFDDHDDLFQSVLAWIAVQQVTKRATRLKAVSKYGSKSEDDAILEDVNAQAANELFHFAKLAAKTPPKYEPAFGTYYFWWHRRFFIFERNRRDRGQTITYNNQPEEEQIRLKTIGWSTEPIKELLQHIKKWHVERKTSKTTIRRPAPKERRGYHQNPWSVTTTRHSRPMETVVLEKAQKQALVDDINEFLSPASPRWYATRGIPYRRGYLFHGPPGTGKSSLSFALAGLFGLDIHVISLLESTMTEADLNHMFNTLPKRCVVLLEDIDTAGLKREANEDADPPASERHNDGNDNGFADLAKELRRAHRVASSGGARDNASQAQGVSLSGLLNAIDGVASHEGRVLVMTTNHPEKLDPALIRPGRVDMRVEFGLASRHQIEEIFFRMYWSDSETENGSGPGTPSKEDGESAGAGIGEGVGEVVMRVHRCNRKEVREMAEKFASLLPEGTFSPAEVQNFLIARKKAPTTALEEVVDWKDAMGASHE